MKKILVLAALAAIGFACGRKTYYAEMAPPAPPMADFAAESLGAPAEQASRQLMTAQRGGTMAPQPSVAGEGGAGPLTSFAVDNPDRYLIKNAFITLETEDVAATLKLIVGATQAAGGYVGDLREHKDALGRAQATLVVRVPSSALDGALSQLETLGRVVSRQVTSEDVTEQYLDTEARLRNLKSAEERLLEHLSRSATLEDILKAEKEISRVRGEVEQLEGRLRYLEHRTSFSTINITLTEAPRQAAVVPPDPYSAGKVFSDATRSLVSFLREGWTLLIWIGVWAVIWGPIAIVLVFVWRRLARPAKIEQDI